MLDSENFETKPQSNKGAFQDGVDSSSVVACDKWVTAIHLWDSSAACVFEASE